MNSSKKLFDTSLEFLKNNAFEEGEAKEILKWLFEKKYNFTLVDISTDKEIPHQSDDFDTALQRLVQGEPLQYILEEAFFYKSLFKVTPDVLIPRPETEELVDLIEKKYIGQAVSILEIGTGSGCIAISLALSLPKANVMATDISEKALQVAHDNATQLGASVIFKKDDVLETTLHGIDQTFDAIVSNPPYIKISEKKDMQSCVLDFEPSIALFVEETKPLVFYEAIAALAIQQLKPKGHLFFEINQAYGPEMIAMLQAKGFENIICHKDINQNDRMVLAQKK